MKLSVIFAVFLFLLPGGSKALTVYTANHMDWDQPSAWAGGQVPASPDTIVISHYITFSHSLTINAPTVLLIESTGTLCGDYLLDVACGARIINNGNVYVNSAKIRDGQNYNLFYSKSQVTIMGCPQNGYGMGFFSSGPNAHIWVWPPVLCKTSGTNWETTGSATSLHELMIEAGLSIFPNPVTGGKLTVLANRILHVTLMDASGRILQNLGKTEYSVIEMDQYAPGFYFLQLSNGKKRAVAKLINP